MLQKKTWRALMNSRTIPSVMCERWAALEKNSKLILAYAVGRRSLDKAFELTFKIRRATSPGVRFQLTTDGLRAYRTAVDEMLSDRCDFGQLIKFYSQPIQNEARYSPARMGEAVAVAVSGDPNPAKICTSHIERFNLTLRMSIRRMTRLTNGFSKEWENHRATVSLQIAYYNFAGFIRRCKLLPQWKRGSRIACGAFANSSLQIDSLGDLADETVVLFVRKIIGG